MSLKVLINGPKGSGKSTLAKNIYRFHCPDDTWVIFDRGVAGEQRHSPRVVSKKGNEVATYTLPSLLLELLLIIRKYLEVHKHFVLLEYFMFIVTPVYAKSQLKLSNAINARFLVNAQPLYLRNLRKFGVLASKIGILRKILEWPFQYDFIVNVSIRAKETTKRLRVREDGKDLSYYTEFVRDEINFQRYVLSKYTNVVNIDGYKTSYDLSAEFAVYSELVATVTSVINDSANISTKEHFIERPYNADLPDMSEYFDKHLREKVIKFYGESNTFVNYVMDSYARQHLFVFAHSMAKSAGSNHAEDLAALLVGVWGYLLWFDDVVDNSSMKNNKTTLAGINTSKADAHLSAVKALSDDILGRNQTLWLTRALTISKDSMLKHKNLGLRADYISIICNYLDRGYSYIVWPTSVLLRGKTFEEKYPLYKLNVNKHVGGQLINDMRDIYLETFDDIANGQITIPIALLRDRCTRDELSLLTKLFGQSLAETDKALLKDLFERYDILNLCQTIVNSCFATALGVVEAYPDIQHSPVRLWLRERCKF